MRNVLSTLVFWSLVAFCAVAADEIDPASQGYFSVLRYEWTADGSGNATGLASAPSPGLLYMAVTIPATGTDQPSDNYDIVVKERYAAPGSGTVLLSTDLAGGALANRDNVATERVEVWPDVWKQVGGYLQIEISGAGAGKKGAIEIHVFRTLAFRMFDIGDSVGEGLPIGGATTQILQNNGSGEAKWVTMSGDVTIADGGATTLQINTEAAWETHTGLNWYTENDQELVLASEIDSEAELEALLLDTIDVVTNNDTFYQYFIDSAGTAGQVWTSDGVGKGTWLAAPSGADDMGTVDTEAELEAALTDVTDVLTNNDANYAYLIDSAGMSGQVWTSDGSGAGVWAEASGGFDGNIEELPTLGAAGTAPVSTGVNTVQMMDVVTQSEFDDVWALLAPHTPYFISSDGTAGQVWTSDGSQAGYWANPVDALDVPETLISFRERDSFPPATNYGTFDSRNNHPVLDFDASTEETVYFRDVLPNTYSGNGVTVDVEYAMTSATSGDVIWGAAWELLAGESQDLDSDGFASAKTVTQTVSATSGKVKAASITFADGAEMDFVGAADLFRLKVYRDADAAGDTATGDAELLQVVLREAVAVPDPPVTDLEAIIEVNGPAWMTDLHYPGPAGLTNYYAPMAVFFEGWKSTPRDEIVQYEWDFDDGSPHFIGFNAAHVYETPGVYDVTLTVTRQAAVGATPTTDVDTVQITVNAPDGTTYYVDSVLGNDANPGTSTGAGAWKTATHAFSGMATTRYAPGDRILFNRGQTFDFEAGSVTVDHWKAGYGYSFGAYGSGAKPVIQATGAGGGYLFNMQGVGARFITFQDLEFDCTPTGGSASIFWYGVGGGCNITWLRCDIHDFVQGWLLYCLSGAFIVDSTTYMSEVTHIFSQDVGTWKSERTAILGCDFDFSNNHIAYLGPVRSGVIDDNTFSRVAFGRAALRVIGNDYDNRSHDVWVSDNVFTGWIDPVAGTGAHNGGGTRYNYNLVDFAANSTNPRFGEWLEFTGNTITDAEVMLQVAGWEHVRIHDNLFDTQDPSSVSHVYLGSLQLWDQRPNYDVQVYNNTFAYTGTVTESYPAMLRIQEYVGPEYDGRSYADETYIQRNVFKLGHANIRYMTIPYTVAQYSGYTISNNLIYYADDLADIATHRTTPTVDQITLAEWKALTSQDSSTQIYEDTDLPTPGWAYVDATVNTTPFKVGYSGTVVRASGATLDTVTLWVKVPAGAWATTGLTKTTTSGVFDYTPSGGNGTYYFAVVAKDSLLNESLTPINDGDCSTVYTAP